MTTFTPAEIAAKLAPDITMETRETQGLGTECRFVHTNPRIVQVAGG
jgi:hypothetical protein